MIALQFMNVIPAQIGQWIDAHKAAAEANNGKAPNDEDLQDLLCMIKTFILLLLLTLLSPLSNSAVVANGTHFDGHSRTRRLVYNRITEQSDLHLSMSGIVYQHHSSKASSRNRCSFHQLFCRITLFVMKILSRVCHGDKEHVQNVFDVGEKNVAQQSHSDPKKLQVLFRLLLEFWRHILKIAVIVCMKQQ